MAFSCEEKVARIFKVVERYDVGDKFGFLKTTIQYGLQHAEVKDGLREYILSLAKELENGPYHKKMSAQSNEKKEEKPVETKVDKAKKEK